MKNNQQQSDQKLYGIDYCKSNTPITFINSLLGFLEEIDRNLYKMFHLLNTNPLLKKEVLIQHFSILESDLFNNRKMLLMLVAQLQKVISENEDVLVKDNPTYITSTNSKLNFFMWDYVKINKIIEVMYEFDTNMYLDLDNVRDSSEMICSVVGSLKNLKEGFIRDSNTIDKKLRSLQHEKNLSFEELFSNRISKILKDMKEV